MKTKNGQRKRSTTSEKSHRAYIRGKLLERRQRLLRDLAASVGAGLSVEERDTGDSADRALSSLAKDMAHQVGANEAEAVVQVEEALRRLDEGTYGRCEECGAAIPRTRLDALPFARFCIRCQEAIERETGGERLFQHWADLSDGGEEDEAESGWGSVRGTSRFAS